MPATISESRRSQLSRERFMWITPDRLIYVGLLGQPRERTFGALQLYVASEGEIQIKIADGEWQTCKMAMVYPHVPHQIQSDARLIYNIGVEPESVDLTAKPIAAWNSGVAESECLLNRVKNTIQWMREEGHNLDLTTEELDLKFFGATLKPRKLDQRIQSVVELVRSTNGHNLSAEYCAQTVNLSFSRFLHLFKTEIGYPFRTFRSWRKARHMLEYVTSDSSLTNVALEIGYPDSAYFSNSIRQTYGLKPKDMFVGSRKLEIYRPRPVD